MKLVKQYEDIRNYEAKLWKQKSRDKWVKEGDNNTKFFHITTMVRRRKNKIDGLFDSNGNWNDSLDSMKITAKNLFQNLFAYEEPPDLRYHIPSLFPDIDDASITILGNLVSPQEVKNALFAIGGLKSPWFDGVPAISTKSIGFCVVMMLLKWFLRTAFLDGKISDGLNHTLITLVPKVQGPKHMHLF